MFRSALSSFALVLASEPPPALEEASRTFMLFAVVLGGFFAVLILVTVGRLVLRSRSGDRPLPWSEENLFHPIDVAELSYRLKLAAVSASSAAEIASFDTLLSLSDQGSSVVSVHHDAEWGQNGGRKKALNVIFEGDTALRFVLASSDALPEHAPDAGSDLAPGARLVGLEISPDDDLVLVFANPSGAGPELRIAVESLSSR